MPRYRQPQTTGLPISLRIAAVLCAIVGVVSLVRVLTTMMPLLGSAAPPWTPLAVNASAALLMCVAAVLAWFRRRLSLLAIVAAWALPSAINFAAGQPVQYPAAVMALAFITLGANWRYLR
jgi:hypothetical protein